MLIALYLLLGYWAVGKTIYANKILFGTSQAIIFSRIFWAFFLGWLLIPIAVIKVILGK